MFSCSKCIRTSLNTWPCAAGRKSSLIPGIIEWLTLLPLEPLVCSHWPKIKFGLNSIFCLSASILQDEWAAAPRKEHIPHICFYCKPLCKTYFGTSIRETRGFFENGAPFLKESDFNLSSCDVPLDSNFVE